VGVNWHKPFVELIVLIMIMSVFIFYIVSGYMISAKGINTLIGDLKTTSTVLLPFLPKIIASIKDTSSLKKSCNGKKDTR